MAAFQWAFLYSVLTVNVTFPFTLGKLREEIQMVITVAEEVATD